MKGVSPTATGCSQAEPVVSALRASPPDAWHHSWIERPQANSRIVVLYHDGSGAWVGFWTGDVIIDEVGHDLEWDDQPGEMWAYLPDGFTLWIEARAEDPFTFPAQGMAAPSGDETGTGSAVGNSPVAAGHAPIPHPHSE